MVIISTKDPSIYKSGHEYQVTVFRTTFKIYAHLFEYFGQFLEFTHSCLKNEIKPHSPFGNSEMIWG